MQDFQKSCSNTFTIFLAFPKIIHSFSKLLFDLCSSYFLLISIFFTIYSVPTYFSICFSSFYNIIYKDFTHIIPYKHAAYAYLSTSSAQASRHLHMFNTLSVLCWEIIFRQWIKQEFQTKFKILFLQM